MKFTSLDGVQNYIREVYVQMIKISQAIRTKIAVTPAHEKCKEKTRKRSQELHNKIAGTPEQVKKR